MNTRIRSFRRLLITAICLAGFAGLGVFAWRTNHAQPMSQSAAGPGAGAKASAPAQQAAQVEVVSVAVREIDDDVSAVGTLVSNGSVILRPEVAGRVAAIRFQDGMAVKKGDVLVELDAAIQSAEAQQARAELSLAKANADRVEDLFAKQFVSVSARDEAVSRLEVARANAALAQARLDRTRIRAPFDGIVGIRKVNVGDYVRDGDALINIEDIAVLKLDFRLPERYLARLKPGQNLEVTSDVVPGVTFPAEVEAIDPLVDAEGRAVLLRARLANDEGRLRPGVFARVRLIVERRDNVMLIPEAALIPAPGETQYVFRVSEGVARQVGVKTGMRRAAEVEIVEGLAPGDWVVAAGQFKLRDGMPVAMTRTDVANAKPESEALSIVKD
ncbi:MAG: efflux RND transporter periplasmic adaptor subunit [Azoarcus sp.]|jgi:membrane fusion protein (multidrug efflux system)|nr:efflux RND transporter periplasmic adaptor subunit [Azoarcus sp.]